MMLTLPGGLAERVLGRRVPVLAAVHVLRRPGAMTMFASGMLGRAAMGLAPLGVTLLVVGQTGSYALAGAVGATATLSSALVGRYTSRLVDRRGQSRLIPWLLAGHVTAVLGLVAGVTLGAPAALWFLCAGLGGALVVNLGVMTRTRWARITDSPAELSAAYSLESMADEVAFMVGPPLATLLALSLAPVVPVLVGLLLLGAGALLLRGQRSTEPAPVPVRRGRPRGRLFAVAGMPVLFVLMLLMGVVFGTNNLTTVAFAESIGRPELTGLLLAVFPAAALLGGAVLSAVPRRWSLTSQIRVALVTLTLALLPLPFVGTPGAFAVAAFLIGLSVPAIIAGAFALVAVVVPRARLTEALALCGAGITIGIASASSLAGALIDAHGPAWAFPVSGVGAVLALLWFTLRARAMRAEEVSAGHRAQSGRPAPGTPAVGSPAERAALAHG